MRVVLEAGVGALQAALAFDVDVGIAVDQDVVDGRVFEERLKRPQAEHFILDFTDELVAFDKVQRSLGELLAQELLDQFGDLAFERRRL